MEWPRTAACCPFSATFFTFSDYMKPAIRLGALSRLKAVYVFTHDSIGSGRGWSDAPAGGATGGAARGSRIDRDPARRSERDGGSVGLRDQHDGPTVLVLTRQAVPHLDRSTAKEPGVARGAYILAEADGGAPDVILMGTGSEVQLCVEARKKLAEVWVKARVVSMPSWDLFAAQDESLSGKRLCQTHQGARHVEAASPLGWHRWAGDEGAIIGLERFGASAPGEEVLQHLGFTPEHVTSAALRVLGRTSEAEQEYTADRSLVPA
jgi:transketolase